MAGGFGFSRYPQRPAPSAQEVGASLLQQGQMAPAGPAMAPASPMMAGPEAGGNPLAEAQRLRAEGAYRMGAPGQMPDSGEEEGMHSANAVSVAVGEALTRQGGGYTTNPNPFKDTTGHVRQLMQLGLSEIEAQLLVRTGGV